MPARASVAMEMQVPCTNGHFPVSQQTLAEDGTPPRACLMGQLAIAALHGTHSMFPLKSVTGRHTSQTRCGVSPYKATTDFLPSISDPGCNTGPTLSGKDGISNVQFLPV